VTVHDAALKGADMSKDLKSVQDDLAFLRGLAEGSQERGGLGVAGGALYGAAGLLYGLQSLIYVVQERGVISLGGLGNLILAWAPTVIVIIKDRKSPQRGVTNRAVNAAFQATGVANLALIIVFAAAASRHKDFHYWLFHPAVVFILQGAVWQVIYVLRRRMWMLIVALGWLVSGVAMGLLIEQAGLYLLIASFGLFAFMAAPGFYMMRQAMRSAA
jgi:hypothetical protein